jgi:hypothetical protein
MSFPYATVSLSNTSPGRFNLLCPDKATETLLLSVKNGAARAKKS